MTAAAIGIPPVAARHPPFRQGGHDAAGILNQAVEDEWSDKLMVVNWGLKRQPKTLPPGGSCRAQRD